MKKAKINRVLKLLVSTTLASSILFTNVGQIVVHAEEIHSVEENGKTNTIEYTLNEFQEEFYLVLDDEEIVVLEDLFNTEGEISSGLKEAVVLQEMRAFDESVELYDEVLAHESENKNREQVVQLIEEFRELAVENRSLLDRREAEGESIQSEEVTEETDAQEEPTEEATEKGAEEPAEESLLDEDVESDTREEIQSQKTAPQQIATYSTASAAEPITSEREVVYDAVLTRPTDGINTRPYGTEGYELVRLVDDWVGRQVRVTREAVTPRSTWAYIEVTGTNVKGWIDTAGLRKIETILSEKEVKYEAQLTRPTDGINTKPFGVSGSQLVRLVDNWVGRTVRVTREAVTPRSTFAYVNVVGTNVSGWIDKAGLEVASITSEREVLYDAVLTRETDGINTKPYGVEGFELIRTVDDWVGKQVRVTREAVTPRATWAYIEVSGTDVSGWVDIAGIKKVETILSENNIRYEGRLTRSTDGINTKPYGVAGYRTIRLVDDWVGKRVRVTREAVTPRSTFAYINVVGTDVSGWIDKAGIDIDKITAERDVSYDAVLTRETDGINTKPYGTEGFELVRTVDDWVGKQVRVTKEAVTPRATWAYIQVTGTDVSGWIDVAGLRVIETVIAEKDINYEAKLMRPTDGINTKPFGVAGSELIRLVDNWTGRRVRVTREALTPRSTFAYVNVVGTNVSGWIDKAGLDIERIVSEYPVDYNATLKRATDGINTKPYGTEGYEPIRLVDNWVGREVRVTREAVTQRSTWAFVEVIGTGIAGWIDKDGLEVDNYVVYLDPGHGGSDTGASYSGVHEKYLNLSVSLKIRELLENRGYTVVMSRTSDRTVGLYDRPAEANKIGADIFVSVHHNAMPGSSTVRGIETYYYQAKSEYPPLRENIPYHNNPKRLNESLKLAQLMQNELISHTGANNRGVKSGAYVVVRETHMPAVLLELGYMSSPSELNQLQRNSYQNAMAQAVADAVDRYFK